MTTPNPGPHIAAGEGANATRGQIRTSPNQENGTANDKQTAPAQPADTSADKPAEEKRSREQERADRNAIRTFRSAGLDSLRSTFAFSGATSFGGYAAQRDVNFYIGAAPRTTARGPIPAEELADLRAFHVPFEGYEEARTRLRTRRVLVLRGEEESGRRTSALALLTSLVGDHIFDLGQDHELESLGTDDLDDRCGYLLQSVAGSKVATLTQSLLGRAEHTLEQSDSFLVITVPARREARYAGLERYLVDHSVPDPEQVLLRHLRHKCPEAADLLAAWLADPRIREQVDVATKPGSVASLAREMLAAKTDGISLEEFLDRARGAARNEARRLLCGMGQADPELRAIEQLQRCAFLIAVAVFNDAPYLPVAAAAESLSQLLTEAAYPRGTPHRQIFALRRDQCLQWLRGIVEPRHRSHRVEEDSIEYIRLRNQDLPGALLDELWQEYDAVRAPLLRWLRDVATGRSAELGVRAAQAVGKLSTYDFDYVYQEVIYAWGSSQWARRREAAAWAFEVAVLKGDMGQRVRRLLHDWCRGRSRNLQLTAVTTYGTMIGADSLDEALRSLRDLARSDDTEMTKIACNSVAEVPH